MPAAAAIITISRKGHWIIDTPIANPMSIYDAYKDSRVSWGINALGGVIVEVELSDGRSGVGISTGGEPACFIIERHLKRFLVGQSPVNVELIWDQMWRATLPYGRKGLAIHAISAVDLALWDLLGKLRGEPVYALLGGATKDRLPMYATTIRPDLAQEMGFHGRQAAFDVRSGRRQRRHEEKRRADGTGARQRRSRFSPHVRLLYGADRALRD